MAALHVDQAWSKGFLAETAEMVGITAVLVNREGAIVIGPETLMGQTFERGLAAAAGTGSPVQLLWPDGRPADTVAVEVPNYRNLPPFGWRLVGRLESNDAIWPGANRPRGTGGRGAGAPPSASHGGIAGAYLIRARNRPWKLESPPAIVPAGLTLTWVIAAS